MNSWFVIDWILTKIICDWLNVLSFVWSYVCETLEDMYVEFPLPLPSNKANDFDGESSIVFRISLYFFEILLAIMKIMTYCWISAKPFFWTLLVGTSSLIIFSFSFFILIFYYLKFLCMPWWGILSSLYHFLFWAIGS